MESFMLYFSAAGMVVGEIMLLFGIGLLIWGLWLRWHVEPNRRAAQNSAQPPQS